MPPEPIPEPVAPPPAEPPAAEAPRPPPPGALDEVGRLVGWLTGGNSVVRVGVIVLLLGIAFLLKYAADQDLLPIEVRMAGAYALGVALVGIGWRLRDQRHGYAISLQGGGLAIVYLATLAALRFYALMPQSVAFGLLVVTVALEGWLAVRQAALALAVLATVGGFAAPILVSTGGGAPAVMFAWYAVLNAGVFAMAWRHAWRVLNVLGFLFTFGVATAWGVLSYSADRYPTSQGFLLLFTAMYLVIPIRFARRQSATVDAAIVFGLPVAAFVLQYGLVADHTYGPAWSAAVMAGIWGGFSAHLYRSALPTLGLAYLAVATAFGTLAVPLAFSATVTSAAWALEGAGLVWIGLRQEAPRWVVVGVALAFVAGIALLVDDRRIAAGPPFLNPYQLSAFVITLGAAASARLLATDQPAISRMLLVWALGWWLVPVIQDLEVRLPGFTDRAGWFLIVAAGTAVVLGGLGRALAWRDLRLASVLYLPLLVVAAAGAFASELPLRGVFGLAIYAGLPVWLVCLRLVDPLFDEREDPEISNVLHAAAPWVVALLIAHELYFALEHSTAQLAFGAGPLVVLAALFLLRDVPIWPLTARPEAYRLVAPTPPALVALVCAAWLGLTFEPAAGYWPILSDIDAYVLATLGLTVVWLRREHPELAASAEVAWPLSLIALLAVTGLVARTVAATLGLRWDIDPLFDSVVLQAALSLTWTLVALPIMVLASKKRVRGPWVAGAALLGLVTIKLLLVDLSRTGTVARIISFVGVGLLLLVIGYFAPMPESEADETR